MATKTLRVFAEYTSTGFVPMPTAGNIDYGYTLGSTFPATTPTSFQTDNPDLVVTVTAMTDFYVWIRVNGQAWNPSYTRNVRVYPDSPNINNVVMNMIIATGPAGVSSYTQIVQTSNRLYFNGATTDSIYNSKFAGKTYINELNFGTAPGLATVATTGAYADLTGKPSLATVATSGLFTDLSSKPSGTAPLSYNSGTNSFVITQANTSTNGFLSSTDWNTFNNKFATPSGTTLQYVDGTGALQTFPVLASADKLVINVRNSSGVSMPKGSVVYINGATGNKPTVALAQANSDASSAQTLGLLQATLANNAEGNVIIVGSIIDLNTSAFTEGQQLYLSPTTAGAYTTTKPYAPNHLVYVGVVTRAHPTQGVIEVKIQNGYEMDELHDVSAQSPSNNDGLFYNTTTSLWEKKSIATVLGYTPYNGTDTSIKALFSASAPLSYSNGVYSISQATTSSNGYLSSTDWNTFNGKENVLSFTTPLVRTTNTISINQASASTSGFLSSTDWNTFNNKGSGSGSVTSVAMTMPLGLSVSGSPITTSGTFGITLTAGYVIPSTTSTSEWDIAYTNRITSLTLNGSSGTATLAANVLNIPSYTLVGLGGQPALNGTGFVKISGTTISYDNSTYLTTASASSTYQTIITNPVTGTGTINELAYWNSASSIASLAVATYPSLTELAYVKGVTSAIQTQLNAKASTLSGTTNYVAKFTSSSAIGNSNIQDSGTALTFGVASTFASVNAKTNTGNWHQTISDLTSMVSGVGGGISFTGYKTGTSAQGLYAAIDGFKENATSANELGGFRIWTSNGTNLVAAMTINSAQNVGIGVTPSAMTAVSGIELVQGSQIVSRTLTNVPQLYLSSNIAGNPFDPTYKVSGYATQYRIQGYDGTHSWFTAPIGTAGTSVTLTERMRITPAGNVGFGTTNVVSKITTDIGWVTGAGQWASSAMAIYNSTNIGAYSQISFGYTVSTTNASAYIGFVSTNQGANGFGDLVFGTRSVNTDTQPTEAMRITSARLVGIGTSAPSEALHVSKTGSGIVLLVEAVSGNDASLKLKDQSRSYYVGSSGGSYYIYDQNAAANRYIITSGGNHLVNTTSNAGYTFNVSGTIYATGNITANSDIVLKKNLKLIDNPIDKLMQLNGYAYQWKSDDSHQYGVIAQEVEKILPYAVSTGLDGIKGVSYNQIIPVLIEAIKVQNKRIIELESKIA